MANLQFTVEGMSCGHCVSAVEKALNGIGASGKVDLATKQVEVTFPDGALEKETIVQAIEDQGYDVVG
jgi:copper chaperone